MPKRYRSNQGGRVVRRRKYSRSYNQMARSSRGQASVYRGTRYARRHHQFARTVQLPDITVSGSTVNAGYGFTFDQLQNFSEFSALFDEYRIKGVKLTFVPSWNSGEIFQAPGYLMPNIHTAIDLNDSTAVAPLDLMEYDTYRMRQLSGPVSVFVRPCALADIGSLSIRGNFGRKFIKLDAGGMSVTHYGIKASVDGINSTYNFIVRVFAKFYFECRGTK